MPIMKSLKEALRSASFNEHDKLMIWASFTTAFFGFLRSSEFCAHSKATFDPRSTPLVSDVSSESGLFILEIKVSKADPFRLGHAIRLAPSGKSVCPVRALEKHLKSCQDSSKPLFMFSDQTYLTRSSLSDILQSLLQETPH